MMALLPRRKMLRRISFVVLAVLIIFSAAACGAENDQSSQNNSNEAREDTATSKYGSAVSESSIESGKENITYHKVVSVVDGDTLDVDYFGKTERIRIIGVDTPESVHPDTSKNTQFGYDVSSFAKEYLKDKTVGLEFDVQERDQYGRLLAYVYADGKMYNKLLLEKGYASVSTYPPNVKYVEDFTALQKQARERGMGMWAGSTYDEPQSFAVTYRGHTGSLKFHEVGCYYGDMISSSNLRVFSNRNEAIDAGYAACKVCDP